MPNPNEIISFWFDRLPNEPGTGNSRQVWFLKNPEFDRQIETRFRSIYEQAAAGELDHWQETAQGCLALILLLDQFPRNMFRDKPEAFAMDAKALSFAQIAVAKGFDQERPIVQQIFFYLPFEHSENLEHQHQAVELLFPLRDAPDTANAYDYAVRHREVIQRFGRFPHRNQILGRESTPEEVEFLKQPGSSF